LEFEKQRSNVLRFEALFESLSDETLTNIIKQKTPQKGKQGTKRKEPSLNYKNKTQNDSLKGKRTNHVLEPPLIPKNILER
jgi:hypothetical protein